MKEVGMMRAMIGVVRDGIVNFHRRQAAGASRAHRVAALALGAWLVAAPLTNLAAQSAASPSQRDCWGDYTRVLMEAWAEYDKCCYDTAYFNPANPNGSFWNMMMARQGCRINYVMRAESAWFQFLACSAIPEWKP
ncbi:MAG TPA: hypothetical protein VFN38_07600 [Gemmatimonadaceae bacterium]|nr:hypothetical protein [Gemmatimonadaceae bacterium]